MEITSGSHVRKYDTLMDIIVGVASGVIVFLVHIASEMGGEIIPSFINGTVFGVITGFYFLKLTGKFSVRQYAIWALASFLSFCLAYWTFWLLVVAELEPSLQAAFIASSFVGAVVLVFGFRFSFLKIPLSNFRTIILLLTITPFLPYALGLDHHMKLFYFILFTTWQTIATMFFSQMLKKESDNEAIVNQDAVVLPTALKSMLTEKNIALIGLAGAIGVVLFWIGVGGYLFNACQGLLPLSGEVCAGATSYLYLVLIFFAAMLIPASIIFFRKSEVFVFWKSTLLVYLCVYLFIIIAIPWAVIDENTYEVMNNKIMNKGTVAPFASLVYVVYSLVYILHKSYQLKSNKE